MLHAVSNNRHCRRRRGLHSCLPLARSQRRSACVGCASATSLRPLALAKLLLLELALMLLLFQRRWRMLTADLLLLLATLCRSHGGGMYAYSKRTRCVPSARRRAELRRTQKVLCTPLTHYRVPCALAVSAVPICWHYSAVHILHYSSAALARAASAISCPSLCLLLQCAHTTFCARWRLTTGTCSIRAPAHGNTPLERRTSAR